MSKDIAIKANNLSKCYQIYEQPMDRLKQFILSRIVSRPPKQYYREFWALQDVSFEVKKGETVGIRRCLCLSQIDMAETIDGMGLTKIFSRREYKPMISYNELVEP